MDFEHALDRIDGKLDTISARLGNVEAWQVVQDARRGDAEKRRNYVLGILGILIALAGVVAAVFS